MPTPLSDLPEGLDGRPFTVAEARAAGTSKRRLRHAGLVTPFRGVRAHGPASNLSETDARAAALATVLDARHTFGRLTALRLTGVDLPPRLRDEHQLQLVVLDPAARSRRSGVSTRVVPAYGERGVVRGLRITMPPTTFLHLAKELTEAELVMVGDAMTRRDRPVTTVEALAAHVAGAPACHGRARARTAVLRVRPGTDSVPETALRLLIEDAGLPTPVVNAPVVHEGRYLGRPDLSYPALKISIEYLGDVHRTDRRTWRIDVERHQRFRDAGWTVHEATGDTILRPGPLLARLRRSGVTSLGPAHLVPLRER